MERNGQRDDRVVRANGELRMPSWRDDDVPFGDWSEIVHITARP